MDKSSENLIRQIDSLLSGCDPVASSWKYSRTMGGWFDDKVGYESVMTQMLSLIEHVYGSGHPNHQRIIHAFNENSLAGLHQAKGILLGTRQNIANGILANVVERARVEIKTDFLKTAQELAANGEKDPAAVLSVCVLEDSLKRLADKHGVEELRDKELSVIANGLASRDLIERSTQKAILSFMPLRNAAFHAQWDEVTLDTVNMLLAFLPSFIDRYRV